MVGRATADVADPEDGAIDRHLPFRRRVHKARGDCQGRATADIAPRNGARPVEKRAASFCFACAEGRKVAAVAVAIRLFVYMSIGVSAVTLSRSRSVMGLSRSERFSLLREAG